MKSSCKSSCNCYFCGALITKSNEESFHHTHFYCVLCQENFDYKKVITTIHGNGELMFAHIITNDDWQIRLVLDGNPETHIEPATSSSPKIVLSGYPINLTNAKEKLKLCLIYQ
jgi:hypothetical protein